MATGFWTLALMIAFGRIGLGVVMPAINYAALDAVSSDLVPHASGTLNFLRMTGAAVGVNALAIVLETGIAGGRAEFAGMQTADNPATAEVLADMAAMLAAAGMAPGARGSATLACLVEILTKATEGGFQTAVLVWLWVLWSRPRRRRC